MRFGRERNIEVRFIEFMPLDAQQLWSLDRVLTADEMIAMLAREFGPLRPFPMPIRALPPPNINSQTAIGSVSSLPSAGRSA